MAVSEETKRKISDAAKRRWAKPGFRARMEEIMSKFRKPEATTVLCECGCGELARPGNKVIHGHNSRFAHPMLGKKHSESSRKKLSTSHQGPRPWRLGFTHTPEARARLSKSHTGVALSSKHRENIGSASKRVWAAKSTEERERWANNISAGEKGKPPMPPESIKRMALSKKGKRCSPATEFNSETMKALYRNPDYVKKMAKAWNRKPNKPEAFLTNILENLYPGEWKYTGDFSFTINGKCPDFVNCNGQKKIIELFGDYWHRGQDPLDRINTFKPFGYETLVIWENQLKNMDSVIERIRVFMVS